MSKNMTRHIISNFSDLKAKHPGSVAVKLRAAGTQFGFGGFVIIHFFYFSVKSTILNTQPFAGSSCNTESSN